MFLADTTASTPLNWEALFGALIGSITAGLAVLATSRMTGHRDAKKSIAEYIQVVRATKHELTFYLEKLRVLADFLRSTKVAIVGGGAVVIPAFQVYPAYLESLKLDLAKRSEDDNLVQIVSNCHFELSFIHLRLIDAQQYFNELFAPQNPAGMVVSKMRLRSEVEAILGLVGPTLEAFDKTIVACSSGVARKQKELTSYDDEHPFSLWP